MVGTARRSECQSWGPAQHQHNQGWMLPVGDCGENPLGSTVGSPCLGLTSDPGELLYTVALVFSPHLSYSSAGLQPCMCLAMGAAETGPNPEPWANALAWLCLSPSPQRCLMLLPGTVPECPLVCPASWPGVVGQALDGEAFPCLPPWGARAATGCQPLGSHLPSRHPDS